jgi:hypothetical protein
MALECSGLSLEAFDCTELLVIAEAIEGCTIRHVENTIPLASLAPDIVRAVVDARLPRGVNTKRIANPALEWSRQWIGLGIARTVS